ncbi:CzcE family metal-binding protein [Undibacterium sp.]|uniref:CzcE family metal-binding protein n=1 Tax=Undibacterium sp. TaxID=1914977 RepID=UPI0025D88337|nr:CzcE family metal-binding protein [Undibacterium sp.]
MRLPTFIQMLFIGVLGATAGHAAIAAHTVAPFGNLTLETTAQRTITLLPNTKYINVVQGEVIKFTSQGKSFTWNFDTLNTFTFNLAEVAPKEMNIENIQVYIKKNATYRN